MTDEPIGGETVMAGGLHCAVCGERIKPGRTPNTYTHVTRLVAACDMDSDHEAVPAPPR